jgi:hypothetical protein
LLYLRYQWFRREKCLEECVLRGSIIHEDEEQRP